MYDEAFKFLHRQLDRREANLPIEDDEFNEEDTQQPPVSHWQNDFHKWGL